jgi:hypothetical protein
MAQSPHRCRQFRTIPRPKSAHILVTTHPYPPERSGFGPRPGLIGERGVCAHHASCPPARTNWPCAARCPAVSAARVAAVAGGAAAVAGGAAGEIERAPGRGSHAGLQAALRSGDRRHRALPRQRLACRRSIAHSSRGGAAGAAGAGVREVERRATGDRDASLEWPRPAEWRRLQQQRRPSVAGAETGTRATDWPASPVQSSPVESSPVKPGSVAAAGAIEDRVSR